MSKRGENIYKRKDGRWEGRYIKERSADGKARYAYVYGKSYADAKQKLLDRRIAQAQNIDCSPSHTKYGDILRNWIAMSRVHIVNAVFLFLIPGGIVLYNLGGGAEKTIMTFAFFAVLIPLVASILTKLMHSSSNLMLADASFTAIEEMLAEKPLAETKKQPVPQNGEICLNHVSFQYEAGVKALDDVSLTIRPGTVTALVGESGGGKSTVANLIARFWDVSEGSVTVGGVDVRKLDYADLMKHISIVFQDTNLFKMSVAENVAMYKPGASREEIMEVLRQAQCEDILEKLPNGVDSVIGARGVYLSGGEMQRIALARAILKDAPIVLLDEATAFADAENEYLIQRALDILLHGKTVLMIAHRLQTIVHADQIIVMQRGGIAEQGTHEELMQRQGVYAKMYHEYENSVSWKIGGWA